jgi:DNA relaxase NicK
MDENKEILKRDLVENDYFLATEELINAIIEIVVLRVYGIVSNKNLTFDEKFNYLKSQILKEPNIKISILKNFLHGLKGHIVFAELEVLKNSGFEEAKKLYDNLAIDEDIKKYRERLLNE